MALGAFISSIVKSACERAAPSGMMLAITTAPENTSDKA
ncbi:hypothetical protein SynBIOSU31_02505 [Synechococcus sp. BIOS-U3-1]|nr:hypothetical protein SynBIOSU31_02505 [Synechococcus sp. BIOS-U3-1]